jgi:hypothetical protein
MAHQNSRAVTSILIAMSCASLASAQIVTGVAGSPTATTTVSGPEQLTAQDKEEAARKLAAAHD